MLALVAHIFIPVTEKKLREDFGLHRTFFELILFFFVEFVAFGERLLAELRINGGNKGDPRAIGRPHASCGSRADLGELPGFTPLRRDKPQLRNARACGFEQDLLAVRGPPGCGILLAVGIGQLLGRRFPIARGQPDGGGGLVLVQLDGGQLISHELPVRADLRSGHPLELEHVVDLQGPLLGGESRSRQECYRQGQEQWPVKPDHALSFRKGRSVNGVCIHLPLGTEGARANDETSGEKCARAGGEYRSRERSRQVSA